MTVQECTCVCGVRHRWYEDKPMTSLGVAKWAGDNKFSLGAGAPWTMIQAGVRLLRRVPPSLPPSLKSYFRFSFFFFHLCCVLFLTKSCGVEVVYSYNRGKKLFFVRRFKGLSKTFFQVIGFIPNKALFKLLRDDKHSTQGHESENSCKMST